MNTTNIIIIIIAAVSMCFLFFIEWKKLVISVLVLVILEGILRKWIFPQAANLIYFIKDFILIITYYKYFLVSGGRIRKHSVNPYILLLVIWSLIQAFNPELGSPIVGFFGLRAYLLYIPLMWLLPDLLSENIDKLYKFIRSYSLFIIPVCLLAIAQFFSPPSSPLNVYAAASEITTFGVGSEAVVRVTGSFPYITGFGTYLSVSFTLLMPLLSLRQPLVWRNLTIFELLLVVVSSFMTGSRTVVFYEVFFIIAYLFVLLFRQPSLAVPIIQKFTFPVILGVMLIPLYFGKSINLFTERAEANNKEGITRFFTPFLEPINAIYQVFNLKFIDSYGTGSTHQATPLIRSLLNLKQVDIIYANIGEGEWGRVGLELGIMGLIVWICIRAYLIVFLWQTFKKVENSFLQQIALAVFLFHVIQITTPVVFNPTMGVYYWFLSGSIFLLPTIDHRQKQNKYLDQSTQETKSQKYV
jgi:hypothetical protein